MDARRLIVGLGLGAAIASVIVVAGILTTRAARPQDPEATIVRALAVAIVTLEHTIGTDDLTVADAADPARLYAAAETAARTYYTGTLRARRVDRFRALVDDQIHGTKAARGGGVRDIVMGDTAMEANRAVVHLRATSWTSADGSTTRTSATNNWTISFARVDGRWLATNVESDFRG
jgi:hypothetical protein